MATVDEKKDVDGRSSTDEAWLSQFTAAMVWARIAAAVCLLFAGWYAVDKAIPGMLPRIPLSLGVLNISNMWGGGSSIQVHNASNLNSSPTVKGRMWSHAKILYECVWAALDFPKTRHWPITHRTALQQIAQFWELGYARTWLVVLTSLLLSIVLVKWFYGGASRRKIVRIVETPERRRSPPCRTVKRRSSLSVSRLARGRYRAPRFDEDYGLPKDAADRRKREAAAAVLIQRWMRGEFKRRRPDSAPCYLFPSQIDAKLFIDRDDGALVTTVLEDVGISGDSLGPSKVTSSTDGAVGAARVLSEQDLGRVAERHEAPRCPTSQALTSAQLAASLLRVCTQKNPAVESGTSQPTCANK